MEHIYYFYFLSSYNYLYSERSTTDMIFAIEWLSEDIGKYKLGTIVIADIAIAIANSLR